MTKLIASVVTIWLLTIGFAFAQCNLPSYSWQANKNRFVIESVPFTPDLYRWQWSADGITWVTKDAKLHAVSSINCKNHQPCIYTVGVVQNTSPSALWYGIQNGWLVRFARFCNGSWSAFTPAETVSNVH